MSRYVVLLRHHVAGSAPDHLPRIETRLKVFEAEATLGDVHHWISSNTAFGEVTDVFVGLDDENWAALSEREYRASQMAP